jgi:hypothetical protein
MKEYQEMAAFETAKAARAYIAAHPLPTGWVYCEVRNSTQSHEMCAPRYPVQVRSVREAGIAKVSLNGW